MEPLFREELGAALGLVSEDLLRMEAVMDQAAEAATVFMTEAAGHLAKAGGKRLRPALLALASRLGPDNGWKIDHTGAAIELTHLATLYHDDVIDAADVRHGVPSANEKWGNRAAILVGDYLFARASGIAADVGGEVPRVLADAIAGVVQGQVRELEANYDSGRTLQHYFATIEDKTAALLQASTRLGAALGGCPSELVQRMAEFGCSFGLAFQIADDLLDLAASQEELGKPPGTDLRVGVYTLPVLMALETDPGLAAHLGTPTPDVDAIRAGVMRTGAFDRAMDAATEHRSRALLLLDEAPDCPARESLTRLTRAVIDRVPVLE